MKKLTSFLSAISFTILLSACGSGFDTGEGKKIGRIVKIGEHGMFCSTYEAEIIRGGFNDGSGVNGAALNFSIKNKKLYEQLMTVMENQEEIELSFKRRSFSGPCYSETGIIATGFRVLKKIVPENQQNMPVVENNSEIQPTSNKTPIIIQFEDDTL